MHVLCDFNATWHQEASLFLEYTMKINLADIKDVKELSSLIFLPPPFHYSLGMFISCYTFSRNTSVTKKSRVFADKFA